MKKTLLVSLLLLALCLALAACGSTDESAVSINTVDGLLTLHGFAEQDLLRKEGDSLTVDKDGDLTLHSAASFEEVSRAVYDACKKAADDGVVRDRVTEAPIDYAFQETTLYFGYYRGEELTVLMIAPIWADQETGVTDYLLQWS